MFRQVGVKSTGEAKKGGGRNAIHNIQKPIEDTGSLYMYAYSQRSIQVMGQRHAHHKSTSKATFKPWAQAPADGNQILNIYKSRELMRWQGFAHEDVVGETGPPCMPHTISIISFSKSLANSSLR